MLLPPRLPERLRLISGCLPLRPGQAGQGKENQQTGIVKLIPFRHRFGCETPLHLPSARRQCVRCDESRENMSDRRTCLREEREEDAERRCNQQSNSHEERRDEGSASKTETEGRVTFRQWEAKERPIRPEKTAVRGTYCSSFQEVSVGFILRGKNNRTDW
jgi:hypothetical protein